MNIELLAENISAWIGEKMNEAGAAGLLVGVSGGIDSAVTAHLIYQAAKENSLGVIIPIKSSKSSLNDAQALVKQCGIPSITVDLGKVHESFTGSVFEAMKSVGILSEQRLRSADSNLRARLRMNCLYAIANNLNYMVVGTDNLDEYFTGYFTKYGDGGVDIQPLHNIYKKTVYELARYFGVPQSIIDKAPSADLWAGQTDEDEMGVSYDQIENYIAGKTVEPYAAQKIARLHNISEHKRHMPPAYVPSDLY